MQGRRKQGLLWVYTRCQRGNMLRAPLYFFRRTEGDALNSWGFAFKLYKCELQSNLGSQLYD